MSIWILVAQGLLAIGVVAAIAYPMVSRKVEGARAPGEAEDPQEAWEAVVAQKRLAYEGLKELEFDRASGKLSEADYQAMRQEQEAEAIKLMKTLDVLEGPEAPTPTAAPPSCPSCGRGAEPEHLFCAGCGAQLR